MVVLSLRNRQNRECVDEDLRANKKVFERLQQQIAIMPQSEMPANDKLQTIAFQFNKDVENVKNALNDGLTDMNTPDAIERGFADFSKVSLAWNKLVARINPYIKGQQTDPDFQAATAGDYNYVRQKLRDDLQQFFTNAIQQINSFKRGIGQQGGVARVQNEASLEDILQQLGTGFYKNVRYGAEGRTSLLIPRLPPDVQQGQQQGQQGQPPQPPPQPPAAPQPVAPQQYPQDAQIGAVDVLVVDRGLNPYQQDQQQSAQMNLARQQELNGINQRITDDINRFEANGRDITDPQLDPQLVIDSFVDDTRDEVQQFFGLQDDDAVDGFLATIVDALADYRNQRGNFAPQGQAFQPAPAPRPRPAPLDPAAVQAALAQQQQGTPARRGRPADVQRQIAIADKADELGIRQQLSGYAQKTAQEKRQLAATVRRLADALGIAPESLKRNLNQMVGFGRSRAKGGFLGELALDLAGNAFRGATGVSPWEAAKSAFKHRGTIANAFKSLASRNFKLGGAKREGARGRPLRINNDFTGTSVVPNTLAELKNRMRVAPDGDYVGDSTGAIIPNLQNRGVLGSGRRTSAISRQQGRGAAEVIAAIGRMSRAAVEQILFPAFNALGQAIAQGVAVGRQVPPAVRRILETTRGVYRREDVQTLLSYLKSHPDVLIPFLPTPYAVGAVAVRLFQHYLNLPATQTGTEARVGREMRERDEEDDGFVVGDGSGRCCFNSGMCRGTKAYRFNYGQKSANVRKESVRGRGRDAEDDVARPIMEGGGNGVNVNIKYSKLPKALQPTDEDLNPTPKPRSASGGMRRRRMPKESYDGFQDEENDVYTHRGGLMEASPLVHSEMLQDKALGLLKGLPRRLGVEDPKFKANK
jgi:hypothetical protein